MKRITTKELPSHWASALINGDYSGLSSGDSADLNGWMEHSGLTNCVDVSEDTFPKTFMGLLTDCATYTFIN